MLMGNLIFMGAIIVKVGACVQQKMQKIWVEIENLRLLTNKGLRTCSF